MRIVCPECRAAYQVDSIIKNAILVCHRCQTEFDTMGNKIAAENETAEIFKAQEAAAPTFGIHDLVQSGMRSKSNHVLLFMMIVLILLSMTGIAVRWQHWQFNGYARAMQMSMNLSAPILDRDWRVVPDSIHTQWLQRDDQSLALIIEGKVENLISTKLPAPEIKVTFVTQAGKNIDVIQPITEPADVKTMQTVPYASPLIDAVPVPSSGTRGFILLIEDAPYSTQHILLHALAVQRKGNSRL